MQLIDTKSSFDDIYDNFRWNIPDQLNIAWQVCDRHVRLGDKTAVFYENSSGVKSTTSFAELKKYSDQFANALRHLGVKRGDRVAIVLSQRIETVIAHLAIYKLGAIALPLAVLFGPKLYPIDSKTVVPGLLLPIKVDMTISTPFSRICPSSKRLLVVILVIQNFNSGSYYNRPVITSTWLRLVLMIRPV